VIDGVRSPFGDATTIRFTLSQPTRIRADVLDVRGRRVRPLADAWFAAGPHALGWDGRDTAGQTAASGVYLIRLQAADTARCAPVLFLR